MTKLPKHFRYFFSLFVVLLLLDLLTKYLFYDIKIASHLWFIYPMFNLGVSWSLAVPPLVSVSVGCLSLLLFFFLYHKKYIPWWIAAFLMAGTLGNMVDRIMLWGVRDFLMIWYWFPIFNVADFLLTVWIVVYFRKEFFPWKTKLK
jgi:signal peptidase II